VSTPVRIVVADDHSLFRAGLIELLDTVAEFDILDDVASGGAAVAAAADLKPDVLILDVEMPGPGAHTVIQEVARASPETRIVVLTMHDDPDLVRSLIEAGAAGYLVKSAGRNELVAAINTAARGEGAVLIAVSRSTAVGLGRGPLQVGNGVLSPREHEILSLVAAAKSNREIARKLYISEATVKRHLANVYTKLGASSRMEAVQAAIASGILASSVLTRPTDDRD
jgi:DNA-binding NarL/FixJ family response regulator